MTRLLSVFSVLLGLLAHFSVLTVAQEVPEVQLPDSLSKDDYTLVGEILVNDEHFHCMTNTSRVSSARYIEQPSSNSIHKTKRRWNVPTEEKRQQLQASIVLEDGPTTYNAVVDLQSKTVLSCDKKNTSVVFVPKQNTRGSPFLGSLVLLKEGINLFGIQLPPLEIPLMHAGVAVVFFILGLSSD